MAVQTITAPIISLAILKVNWDAKRKDYVDNFVPIVAECIRLAEHDVVSLPTLQSDIRAKFGLRIPQNQLRAVLSRVSRQGYIKSENRAYTRVPERLAALTFDDVQRQVVSKHEQVMSSLVGYARDRFDLAWSIGEAERALYAYLESYQLLDATAVVSPTSQAKDDVAKAGQFVVGAFVSDLREKKLPEFDYFETIAKGDILATAMFLPDPNRTAQKFRKTYVYFDTSILIYALGHAGEIRQAPSVELLQLLYQAGADLRCFSHTLDEIRSILIACAFRMEKGQLADAYGPSIEYFVEKGLQPSDVRLRAARLDRDLETFRVKVVEKPPFDKEYMVDEQALADAIQKNFKYSNQNALWRDVGSISSVIRLRRSHQSQMVEECRAVFVTTNSLLVRAASESEAGSGSHIVPPALTDHALTNLLWLKMPLQAPDLPRKRIIAACFAATQPDEQLWGRYLAEINNLKEDQTVTADDYFLLRHSLQARAALMEVTLGDEESFSSGTVQEILEIVRTDIQRELRCKLDSETGKRIQTETEAAATIEEVRRAAQSALEQREAIIGAEMIEVQAALNQAVSREQARRLEIRARAVTWGRTLARIIGAVVFLLLAVGSASTFPFWTGQTDRGRVRALMSILQALIFVLGLANFMWGTTVESFLRRLELVLAEHIDKRLSSLTGGHTVSGKRGSDGPSEL